MAKENNKSSDDSSLYRGALSIMNVMARRSAEELNLSRAHRSTSPFLPPDMKQIFDELPKVRSRSKVNKTSSMEPPSSMEPRAIASRLSKATEAMWTTLGTIAADMEESERKLGCDLEYVADSTSNVMSSLSQMLSSAEDSQTTSSSSSSASSISSSVLPKDEIVAPNEHHGADVDNLWNGTEVLEEDKKDILPKSSLDSRPMKRPRKLELKINKAVPAFPNLGFDPDSGNSVTSSNKFPAPLPRKALSVSTDLSANVKLQRNGSTNSLNNWVTDSSFDMDMGWMDHHNDHSAGWGSQLGHFRKASPSEEPATPDIIEAINGSLAPAPTAQSEGGLPQPPPQTKKVKHDDSDDNDDEDDDNDDIGDGHDDDFEDAGGGSDSDSVDGLLFKETEDGGLAVAKKSRSLSVLCFSRALLFNPSNVPALISLAREAMRRKQWRLGAERLRRAIITDSGISSNKSKAKSNGKPTQELPLMRSDSQGGGDAGLIESSVWRDFGFCLLKLNDTEGAAAAYASALSFYTPDIEDPPTSSSSLSAVPVEASVGLTLSSALQELAQSWSTDAFPRDAELWFGIGLLHARRGHVNIAEEALRASILLGTDANQICGARLKMACLLKCSGNLQGATEALQSFQIALDHRKCSCRIRGICGTQNPGGSLLGVPNVIWVDEKDDNINEIDIHGNCVKCATKHVHCGCAPEQYWNRTHALKRQLLIELGHVLEIKGDWTEARSSYEAALVRPSLLESPSLPSSSSSTSSTSPSTPRVLSESPPLLQQLGWLLHTRFGDLEGATEMLIRATSLPQGAKDWRGWFLLGRLYMAHGDVNGQCPKYHEAYRAFETAVHIDPLNPRIWASIGVLFSRLKQTHDALDAHGRALRLDPSQYRIWANVAALYDMKGQLKDALEAYEIGLSLVPSTHLADNAVVSFRKRIGELKAELAETAAVSTTTTTAVATTNPATASASV